MNESPPPSPKYVAVLVSFLVLAQLGAFWLQFHRGFRPFVHEPGRVPFSWDMFANKAERCVMTWTPELQTPAGRISSLREIGTGAEWDVVFDRASDYRMIALWLCAYGDNRSVPGARFSLTCFHQDGTSSQEEVACGQGI